ncbi:NAD(P)H-dependent glycerol-3-phosphate dehydrogenase [Agriterribacter sp.]|uniref:NAD(P)H-dependent glycerol-3-phosphate dehydrogenase n=1 Tax=Agriterribacter sp. TaxID=2821509 RepID=UPI002CAFEF0D|nr:NAD(P)H-dependent glycerol-3-phosphate dehydrogenase [Agriterribacter sp.]HTN08582.1 NAD(P)H-dependent glycerol-3-phosphate dehydrogenase [Agriterribacter sp.]
MQFGIIGSGSWGTALAKMLTGNGIPVNWCVRNDAIAKHLMKRLHNPNYLQSVSFDAGLLTLFTNARQVFAASDHIVIVTPSAYVIQQFSGITAKDLAGKKIISAVKGILPQQNLLLNDYLKKKFDFSIDDYFTIMGPCHAEEVAAERLSYLTFSGTKQATTKAIAGYFSTPYINTIVNHDIYGVQYAAILKNIYAVAAGMANGLGYGDNFLSVLIANSADEMAVFLRKAGIRNVKVGVHTAASALHVKKSPNYAASVYLGDLLVTCYSLFSRNRSFGALIGKGHSVVSAQTDMKMVAEGYNAARSIHELNKEIGASMPIAENIYQVLWKKRSPRVAFKYIEDSLV